MPTLWAQERNDSTPWFEAVPPVLPRHCSGDRIQEVQLREG
jgi:hypothetical protein